MCRLERSHSNVWGFRVSRRGGAAEELSLGIWAWCLQWSQSSFKAFLWGGGGESPTQGPVQVKKMVSCGISSVRLHPASARGGSGPKDWRYG